MNSFKAFIIILILLMFTGCDPLYSIFFVNQSDRSIIVNYYSSNYPDTTVLDYWDETPIATQDTSRVFEVMGKLLDFFRPFDVLLDTVSFFVYDADTINNYSWDTVVKYNMVLQRYDLSLNDLEGMNVKDYYSILYFPPTETMKHIHMWPPYGTYNTNN